jgi:hypothetical protein
VGTVALFAALALLALQSRPDIGGSWTSWERRGRQGR